MLMSKKAFKVNDMEVNAGQHCLDVLVFHTESLISLFSVLSCSWSSDGQYCRVVKDSVNYVECACSHLSIYAAYAEFAILASYNEAFYASGIICISGINTVHFIKLLLYSGYFFSF